MNPEFLRHLRQRGIEVTLEGDNLRLSPREAVTPHILRIAKENKAQIIGELKAEAVDPRPDLCEDSPAWIRLLEAAARLPVFYPLHGFRCMGARLAAGRVEYDARRTGFKSSAHFKDLYERWLQPHADALRRLLK